MKLIIKQYLASLKERDELDALLPDLLSQMGMIVFSRPARGTRQDGVDIGAVGSMDGGPKKVYLFSIKAGDLTRQSWDGDAAQSLRPSLNSIKDVYIQNRLPEEHKNKEIVVCLCFGGDIQEQVRTDVEGYIRQNKTATLVFEEWNGDKLSSLILTNFLHEDIMPKHVRTYLRKSLALLDEPEASYHHFSDLIQHFSGLEGQDDKAKLLALRQLNICVWILFAWSRDAGNLESAYLSVELALLHSWKLVKKCIGKKTKSAKSIQQAFNSLLNLYFSVTTLYAVEKILPHVHIKHGLSAAIRTSNNLDINFKLFDVLGRLSIIGMWEYWHFLRIPKNEGEALKRRSEKIKTVATAIKKLIFNNPALLLPVKDEQAIDITIAIMLLLWEGSCHDVKAWLSELMGRASFTYSIRDNYPCVLSSYHDFLEHPQSGGDYFQEVTSGSILLPTIALYAALMKENEIYSAVQTVKKENLSHCNFQLWYPDENSEECLYDNKASHGAILSSVCIDRPMDEFLNQVFNECKQSPFFNELSAIEFAFWPLIVVACRHYRLPIPIHLWEGMWEVRKEDRRGANENN